MNIPVLLGDRVLPWYVGLAATVIWVLAITNAFNLIDGLDGLGSAKEFVFSLLIGSTTPEVVVAQTVLGDGDGVVLHADVTAVVELRNSRTIVIALVIRLFGEEHVIFAKFRRICVWVLGWRFVPERKLARAAEEIGADNTAVVGESRHGWNRTSYYASGNHGLVGSREFGLRTAPFNLAPVENPHFWQIRPEVGHPLLGWAEGS